MPEIQIMPSLLAADMGRLEEACKRAEDAGADALHLDVMDGHFVPNISMGPAIVAMARRSVSIPLNVHLMISNPEKMSEAYLDAGSDTLLIHIEVECDVPPILEAIRARGVAAGITLNPDTPAEAIQPVLDQVDEVLCMTVFPGFGGQAFIEDVLPKIAAIRAAKPDMNISVDGGLDLDTISMAAGHGANLIVAGTSLYSSDDMARDVALMREKARTALKATA